MFQSLDTTTTRDCLFRSDGVNNDRDTDSSSPQHGAKDIQTAPPSDKEKTCDIFIQDELLHVENGHFAEMERIDEDWIDWTDECYRVPPRPWFGATAATAAVTTTQHDKANKKDDESWKHHAPECALENPSDHERDALLIVNLSHIPSDVVSTLICCHLDAYERYILAQVCRSLRYNVYRQETWTDTWFDRSVFYPIKLYIHCCDPLYMNFLRHLKHNLQSYNIGIYGNLRIDYHIAKYVTRAVYRLFANDDPFRFNPSFDRYTKDWATRQFLLKNFGTQASTIKTYGLYMAENLYLLSMNLQVKQFEMENVVCLSENNMHPYYHFFTQNNAYATTRSAHCCLYKNQPRVLQCLRVHVHSWRVFHEECFLWINYMNMMCKHWIVHVSTLDLIEWIYLFRIFPFDRTFAKQTKTQTKATLDNGIRLNDPMRSSHHYHDIPRHSKAFVIHAVEQDVDPIRVDIYCDKLYIRNRDVFSLRAKSWLNYIAKHVTIHHRNVLVTNPMNQDLVLLPLFQSLS